MIEINGFQVPEKKDYDWFIYQIIKWQNYLIKGTSALLYGSYARGNPDIGVSDQDLLFVFPFDVEIPKREYLTLSNFMNETLSEKPYVLHEVMLDDIGILSNPRFTPYDSESVDTMLEEAVILFGENPLRHFARKTNAKSRDYNIASNMFKSRKRFILSDYFMNQDTEEARNSFRRYFESSMTQLSRIPGTIGYLIEGEMESTRSHGLAQIETNFPDVDLNAFFEYFHLRSDPQYYFHMLGDEQKAQQLWLDTLSCCEKILFAYINQE